MKGCGVPAVGRHFADEGVEPSPEPRGLVVVPVVYVIVVVGAAEVMELGDRVVGGEVRERPEVFPLLIGDVLDDLNSPAR